MKSIAYYVKAALKAVSTPRMRDGIKKSAFQIYTGMFAQKRCVDKNEPFGINLIGHARGDYGLGESCRLVAGALKELDVPLSVFNVSLNSTSKESNMELAGLEGGDLPYRINLIHVNPNKLSGTVWVIPPAKLRGHYNIAYWLWELPEFPEEWLYTLKLFDEIWTPAQFITDTLKKYTEKPVYTMPYGLRTPKTDKTVGREYFGLPKDKFLFMVSYDGNSVSARKNPEGSIRAYVKAFSPDESGVGLVVKATHESSEGLERMRELLKDYPNIYVLTESYSREVFNSLIACVDAYVSLHRAEGFGLVMAESMLLGTPTIATNWSANTEFMDSDVACMVDAEIVELEKDYPPYHKGNHWARPDEDEAAGYMRRLFDDREYGKELARKAKARLETKNTPQKAAEIILKRLQELKQG